jgi:hypothetical protein
MLSRAWSSKGLRSPLAAGLALIVAITACQLGPAPAATVAPPTKAPVAATATAASPNPTVTQDLGILYFDDFSDINSGWPILQVDNGQASYQSPDVYRLDVIAPGTVVQASHPGAFSDYSLETIMASPAAGSGQWRHGFTFRQVTPDNYYAFLINPRAQTWQVLKRFLGEWTLLAEGTSSAIGNDPATPVTLRVDALGAAMTFSINGTGVVALTDSSFAAGEIGFLLETLDEPNVLVAADEITVRRYDPTKVPAAPTAAPIVPTETQTGTPPTPTPTSNRPLSTPRPTLAATNDLLTAVAGTAEAAAATAAALATQGAQFTPPPLCGVPGLPDCP